MKKVSLLFMLMLSFVLCDAQPKIQFFSYEYDFGEIKEADGKVTYKFEFRNVGNKDLILTEVKPSCGCLVANYSKNSIAPGQSGFIEAIYNPYRRPGKFIKGFKVKTNEPKFSESSGEQPYILNVCGTVEGLTEAERANDIAKTESSQVGATSAHDAPVITRKSVTVYVGNGNTGYNCNDVPMCLGVSYDEIKGIITFELMNDENGNHHCLSGICRDLTLGNGGTLTNIFLTFKFGPLNLDQYNEESLIISTVTVSLLGEKRHTYSVNKEISDFKAWKADYWYKHSLKGSLKDEINYLKICPYDNHIIALENDIVDNKIKEINDIIYVNENYSKLKYRLEDKMLKMIASASDCNFFIKYYDSKIVEAEEVLYDLLKETTSLSEVNSYLEMFPNGKHVTVMKALKMELEYRKKALDGGISDCAAYISKFPNGHFISEISSKKSYLEALQTNSNKALWKMGNKICHCNTSGITMVTLDQWNEDKSSFKGIVVASPGGLYEGNILQKGNMLWLEPKGWHKCLEEEVSYALGNDKSAEAEKLLSERNMKFRRGTVVSYQFSSRGFLGLYNNYYNIIAKVEDWNEDFTKMKIQIVKTDGVGKFDGEDIYEGKYIWVSPIGWK